MQALTLKSHHISRPVAYSFRFESYGWAIFTINDQTGELSLHSDWGTYGHRWHVDALGKVDDRPRTLTEFLARCDGHYVAKKFRLDTGAKELDDVVDREKTLGCVRERIMEMRRSRYLDRETARKLWDQADEWEGHDFSIDGIESDLYSFLGEPWEYICMAPSVSFTFLQEVLWPFFRDWLRANTAAASDVAEESA